jgi:hypothetical protein
LAGWYGTMVVEIEGKVVGTGRIKGYNPRSWNYGSTTTYTYKFFMAVQDDEGVEHKAMVEVEGPENRDNERKRPFRGDRVKYTSHSTRNGWHSVTMKQSYEIVSHDGFEEWKVWKAEQEKKEAEEKARQAEEARKLEEAEEAKREAERLQLEAEMKAKLQTVDDTLGTTLAFVNTQSKLMTLDQIVRVLRDVRWLGPLRVGHGGKRAEITLSGTTLEDGYPGTGMRRPNGCLYNRTKTHRSKILAVLEGMGLITVAEMHDEEEHVRYDITELGVKVIGMLDTCPECGTLRHGCVTWNSYNVPQTVVNYESVNLRCMCECEKAKYEEMSKLSMSSNCRCGISKVLKDRFAPASGAV